MIRIIDKTRHPQNNKREHQRDGKRGNHFHNLTSHLESRRREKSANPFDLIDRPNDDLYSKTSQKHRFHRAFFAARVVLNAHHGARV
jgi:hypothetical protein